MEQKNILIIGGGGREHALAWKLKQSPKVDNIFVAPGNSGTENIAENVNILATDITALASFAKQNNIYLTVVGQDDPLALGIVDEFKKQELRIWGPTQAAAQIESSKVFAKQLMKEMDVPTAAFETFTNYEQAQQYIKDYYAKRSVPIYGRLDTQTPMNRHATGSKKIVIKASGLALGKGVIICSNQEEAEDTLKQIMSDKIFGDSGNEVVIEEFMEGPEFSIHAFCDGANYKLLPPAQDHKPIFDGNLGPNTGGMGTIAPLPWVTEEIMSEVKTRIVEPILEGLKKHGAPFVGLLYPGLMLTKDGPKVIEFNARFGDPETQSLMRLLKTDLFDILEASVDGSLNKIEIEYHNHSACCIVLASGGYPEKYKKGKEIFGIDEAEKNSDVLVFHAGSTIKDGKAVTNGGRVLGVTATGPDLETTLNKAYTAIHHINFEGMQYRKDIGKSTMDFSPKY